jgi:hypothetical protein
MWQWLQVNDGTCECGVGPDGVWTLIAGEEERIVAGEESDSSSGELKSKENCLPAGEKGGFGAIVADGTDPGLGTNKSC